MKSWLFLLLSLPLFGDDIQRVESVVEEIQYLRSDYEACKKKLQEEGQDSLKTDIQSSSQIVLEEKNQELIQLLQEKDTLIELQKNLLKTQQVKQKTQDARVIKESPNAATIVSEDVVCKENNPFPKLKMKEVKERR